MTNESNEYTEPKTAEVSSFWSNVDSFDQLGLISVPHIDFRKSHNGHNDHK